MRPIKYSIDNYKIWETDKIYCIMKSLKNEFLFKGTLKMISFFGRTVAEWIKCRAQYRLVPSSIPVRLSVMKIAKHCSNSTGSLYQVFQK